MAPNHKMSGSQAGTEEQNSKMPMAFMKKHKRSGKKHHGRKMSKRG